MQNSIFDSRSKTFAMDRTLSCGFSFSETAYTKDEFAGCKITGTVSNTFSEQKDDLQLRVSATLSGGELVTGGFTYVDTVFPQQDAAFEVSIFSDAACQARRQHRRVFRTWARTRSLTPRSGRQWSGSVSDAAEQADGCGRDGFNSVAYESEPPNDDGDRPADSIGQGDRATDEGNLVGDSAIVASKE